MVNSKRKTVVYDSKQNYIDNIQIHSMQSSYYYHFCKTCNHGWTNSVQETFCPNCYSSEESLIIESK